MKKGIIRFQHRVCKSWHRILSELDIWGRLFDRKWHRRPDFRNLCRFNGWSREKAKAVEFGLTDFKHSLES
jgi:hypothetical protein